MIIIGEKINGAIMSVRQAINDKDAGLIAHLAIAQTGANADYLDICAGTEENIEVETLSGVSASVCIWFWRHCCSQPHRLNQILALTRLEILSGTSTLLHSFYG